MAIWKDIQGYENKYQVSNDGRVRSLNYRGTGETRELKQVNNDTGYLQVTLCKDGRIRRYNVHRLVAEAFIPNPNNLPQVSHLDETRNNNCVDNLEWATAKDNCNMPLKRKRQAAIASESQDKHKRKVLCLDNYTIYESTIEAARQLGLNHGNISSCCLGKRNHTGGYHFEFIT